MSIYMFGQSFGLQPAYYFSLLFLIKYLILKKGKICRPNKFLIAFIIICILSTISLIINKDRGILILNQKDIYTYAEFSVQNITQLFNIIFCFVLYWFIKDYFNNNNTLKINSAVKVLICSTAAICFLGFYQELAYVKGWRFDEIFRNGLHGNIQPFGSFIRAYSVTNEPSVYAYFLAPILALVLSVPNDIIKHRILIILLIIISGIMSTSTTFIIGILALLIKIILDKSVNFFRMKRNKNQKMGLLLPITFIFIVILSLILFRFNSNIKELLTTGMLSKLQGNGVSGQERMLAFQTQMNAALKYPLLGVGYGTARSKDLFSTWLCNIGFIGMSMFLIYLYKIITNLKKTNKLGYGISNYIFVLFVCAFISVPEPYFLFIWIMLAIGESLVEQNLRL